MIERPAPELAVTILATSDLHARIMAYDYFGSRPAEGGCLAGIATRIADLRAEGRATMVLDNGDFLFGTPITDPILAEMAGAGPATDAMIRAMNDIGYDAVTVGNHDLDHGSGVLEAALTGLNCPAVSANLLRRGADAPGGPVRLRHWVKPWILIDRDLADQSGRVHTLRIGVIGFLPPQTLQWNHSTMGDSWRIRGVVAAARREVPRLRAAGADIVVALCHSGIGRLEAAPAQENAACALAGVGGIDAIVCGHTHLTFPGPDHAGLAGVDNFRGTLQGVPAVMPGCYGASLGRIDLGVRRDGDGWRVIRQQVGLEPVADRPGNPAVVSIAASAHARTINAFAAPVGHTSRHLHMHFPLLGRAPAVGIVAEAIRRAAIATMPEGPDSHLPLLSVASPTRAGARGDPAGVVDIQSGDVTLGDLRGLHPYPDRVAIVGVTGADIARWLERSAAIFRQLGDEDDQPLRDAEVPMFWFDAIYGLTYEIDPRAAAGRGRVRRIAYRGVPIARDARFALAVTDYRAGRGGGFAPRGSFDLLRGEGPLVADAIATLAMDGDLGAVLPPTPWRFAQDLQCRVRIGVPAPARDRLSEIEAFAPKVSGDGVHVTLSPRPAVEAGADNAYLPDREVGAGRHLANPVRSGRKQP